MSGRRWIVVVPVLAGGLAYAVAADPTLPMIPLQLAGTTRDALEITHGHKLNDLQRALVADWALLIPGYVLTLLLAAWRMRRRPLLMAAIGALGVMGGYCDAIENIYTWQGLSSYANADFRSAQVFAIAKWITLIPAALLAALSLRLSGRR